MNLENIIKTWKETDNPIIRRIDEIGRIVIPIKFRKGLVKLYLYEVGDCLVLSPNNEKENGLEIDINEVGMISINLKIRNRLNWLEKDQIIIGQVDNYIILKKLREDSKIL